MTRRCRPLGWSRVRGGASCPAALAELATGGLYFLLLVLAAGCNQSEPGGSPAAGGSAERDGVTLGSRPARPSPVAAAESAIDPRELRIRGWHAVQGLPCELAQFETVFWEPEDTSSLRAWLSSYPPLASAEVLEVGTGTGLLAVWCAWRGARHVVATDINPQAVANAIYNAAWCGWEDRIEVRLVPADRPAPFAVVAADERFDLIISNPPWEDAAVGEVAAYALYDPGFELLDGLLQQAAGYLRPHGKLLLAYGARAPIERIEQLAPELGWQVQRHDTRSLGSLPAVFVPGMLLELSPVAPRPER